jgi:hypothetical protein
MLQYFLKELYFLSNTVDVLADKATKIGYEAIEDLLLQLTCALGLNDLMQKSAHSLNSQHQL